MFIINLWFLVSAPPQFALFLKKCHIFIVWL